MDYSIDAALSALDDDSLNRQVYSKAIANLLATAPQPRSIVVGVNAPWGEGKSTVLNFVELELKRHPGVICIRYNPWLFQGAHQVVMSFFELLAEELTRSFGREARELASKLRKIGTSIGGSVTIGFAGASFSPSKLIESLSDRSIEETKDKVSKLLEESKKRVVIIIDDIDRMDDEEVATLFKLVKISADFRHTSYVMAFDEIAVARALRKKYGGLEGDDGTQFVEKIVQIPLALPAASAEVIRNEVLNGIARILLDSGFAPDDGDNTRLTLIFDERVAPHIPNLRTVKRLINVVTFAAATTGTEVNYVDLALIEAIRILFPPLHTFIKAHREQLLGMDPLWLSLSDDRSRLKEMADHELAPYLELIPLRLREDAVAILQELFPFARTVWANHAWEPQSEWGERRRICSVSHFDRYFAYGIPVGDVSTSVIKELVAELAAGTLGPEDLRRLMNGTFDVV